RILSAFFRILEKSARQETPSATDLKILLNALNRPKHEVHWENNMVVAQSYGLRDSAEELVEYLRRATSSGPVHGICGDCGTMFVRHRDRKLCNSCSKQHQTYKYRKEYLQKKKKEYYRRDVVQDRQVRKQLKGAMHGKTKKRR